VKVDVLVVPPGQMNANLAEKNVVVIDVLRATSTIVTALGNQAIEIIPVAEPVEVADLIRKLGPKEYLTGGERKGLKIEGFDLGNSPAEYTGERVGGKKLILCTTNGTKAIKAAQGAAEACIGSFLNAAAVIDHLRDGTRDITLICSGRDQNLCLEDLACAGWMVRSLQTGNNLELTDAAKLALYVWEKAEPDLEGFIEQTRHGQYLQEIGMGEDIGRCLNMNQYPIIPRYDQGRIKL
jgi:Phosphosulfolactate phosphohydrolase and related enzymes